MHTSTTIRAGNVNDLFACMACLPPEWGGGSNASAVAKLGQLLTEGRLWVAQANERIIGMVGWDETFAHKSLFLQLLVVHPDWRKQGVGGSLIRHAIEYARARGARRVIGDVAQNNAAIHDLGEKLGARIIGKLESFQNDGNTSEFLCIDL